MPLVEDPDAQCWVVKILTGPFNLTRVFLTDEKEADDFFAWLERSGFGGRVKHGTINEYPLSPDDAADAQALWHVYQLVLRMTRRGARPKVTELID